MKGSDPLTTLTSAKNRNIIITRSTHQILDWSEWNGKTRLDQQNLFLMNQKTMTAKTRYDMLYNKNISIN